MSNGHLPKGVRPMICYANECNPTTNPDWYEYKHRHFGGDDGVDFIAADSVLALADAHPSATGLRILLSPDNMSIEFAFD